MSVDLDLDDSERLNIIGGLVQESPEIAAAIQWLTWQTIEARDTTWPYEAWQYEAAPLINFPVSDEDLVRGLRLIACTERLPDRHRIAACCDLVEYDKQQAYQLVRDVTRMRSPVIQLVDGQHECALALIQCFVLDDTVAFAERVGGIEFVEVYHRDWALSLYGSLTESAALTDQQRDAARSAVKRLHRD